MGTWLPSKKQFLIITRYYKNSILKAIENYLKILTAYKTTKFW